ncbi:MAG: hypothetical protein M3541_11885 [Acidobacteriota bacterium]|nr:hypothetical protein [Acidobacteriota bacterium]
MSSLRRDLPKASRGLVQIAPREFFYLKTRDLRIGLLINFNVPVLEDGFKRVIRQGRTAERQSQTRDTTTERHNEEF